MSRSLLALVALLFACSALAAPAPKPQPFVSGWDDPVDPDIDLKGIYHLAEDRIYIYEGDKTGRLGEVRVIEGLKSAAADELLGNDAEAFRAEVELVHGASHAFDRGEYLAGRLTPVFFGSAINNFGVRELLDAFVEQAPSPRPRATVTREVQPFEEKLSGFVFKIQ